MLRMVKRYAKKVTKKGLPLSELALIKAFPELSLFMIGRVLEFLSKGYVDFNKVVHYPEARERKRTHCIGREHLREFFFCKRRKKWIEKNRVRGVTFSLRTQKWRCYDGRKFLGAFSTKGQAVEMMHKYRAKQRNEEINPVHRVQ